MGKAKTFVKKVSSIIEKRTQSSTSTSTTTVTSSSTITSTNAVTVVTTEIVHVVQVVETVTTEVTKTIVEQENRLIQIEDTIKDSSRTLKVAIKKHDAKKAKMIKRIKAAKRNKMDANAKLKVAQAQKKVA